MRVLSLDHIVLRVADVERSLAFYVGRLGLAAVRVDEWRRGEAPFPSVRVDDSTIIDLFAAERDGTNVDHVCFAVVDADLDAIAAEFAPVQRATHNFGAQGYAEAVYFADPDGNMLELRAYS